MNDRTIVKMAIGTKNPAKIHAVQETLIREKIAFLSVDVESGVSTQPFSDVETMNGAINRAKRALEITNATLGIGLEGGVVETKMGFMLCNWGALYHLDGGHWVTSGAKILLPDFVASRLIAGEELGTIMKSLSGDDEIHKKQGAIGWFTNGWVSRKELFAHIVRLLYGQYMVSINELKH